MRIQEASGKNYLAYWGSEGPMVVTKTLSVNNKIPINSDERGGSLTSIVTRQRFNFKHIGSQVTKKHSAHGTCKNSRQVENLQL